MKTDAAQLEKEAHLCLTENNHEQAFKLFKNAALIHKQNNNHKHSALCYASAASCWSKKSEEKTFFNAASAYEMAAYEANLSEDFEYASMLYKYAAINYERDGEYYYYSDCFYQSKESYRNFLTYRFLMPDKIHPIAEPDGHSGIKGFVRLFFTWAALTFSYLIWGHGERPLRTFFTSLFIIFASAFFYMSSNLFAGGVVFMPRFFQALYFSVVTFTTVGYGDIVPVGISKAVVMIEVFSGLFVMPLFVVGLTRKYLRL
ncbi:MAG: ion channel [Candidatus Omnitrophota bacterium]